MSEAQVSFVTPTEKEFIDKIHHAGIPLEKATVAVYLFFNRIIKPREELEKILAVVCPAVLSEDGTDLAVVSNAIDWMVELGLATDDYNKSLGTKSIRVSEDFPEKIEILVKDPGIANELRMKYASNDLPVVVEPKGPVGRREENYNEMITHIKLARKSIKYAVLTTPAYAVTVQALITAAKRGVQVEVLVACEQIAQKYKSKASTADEWRTAFRGIKNATVKIFDDDLAGELCSSIIIDDKILRLDIYDFKKTRSLDGYLIEVSNKPGENINIIAWTVERFDRVWKKSCRSRAEKIALSVFSPGVFATIAFLACLYAYFHCALHPLVVEIDLLILGSLATYLGQKVFVKVKQFACAFLNAFNSIRK